MNRTPVDVWVETKQHGCCRLVRYANPYPGHYNDGAHRWKEEDEALIELENGKRLITYPWDIVGRADQLFPPRPGSVQVRRDKELAAGRVPVRTTSANSNWNYTGGIER